MTLTKTSLPRVAAYAILALAVLIGGFGAYLFWNPAEAKLLLAAAQGIPIVEAPPLVELGECQFGDQVTATVHIRNAGGGELVIDQVRTSCACFGLERRLPDGNYEGKAEYRLAPKERGEFAVRFTAHGTYGAAQRVGIQFRTNDPSAPETRVQFLISRIRAGLTAVPPELVLGTLTVNRPHKVRLEVRDNYDPPRVVAGASPDGSDQFDCLFTPLPAGAPPTDRNEYGQLVGHLDVTVSPTRIGRFAGSLQLRLADDARLMTRVSVSGEVSPPVRVAPTLLLLPRRTEAGPVYSAPCLCRTTEGPAPVMRLNSAPEDLEVAVDPVPREDGAVVVRVAVRDGFKDGKPRRLLVKLKARVGADEHDLDLPVIVTPAKEG